MKGKKALPVLLQALVAAAVVLFVWRSVSDNWNEFRALDVSLDISPGWILGSLIAIWVSYLLLVAAWRTVILGWGERFRYSTAISVWTLSNLGRYLPGKVWSVAGLAVLAKRNGVSGAVATGAAVAMQAAAVASGVAVAALLVPSVPLGTSVTLAAVAAGGLIALAYGPSVDALSRLTGRGVRRLPWGSLALAVVATAVAWIGYGAALAMLERGMFHTTQLDLGAATGIFSASYIVGLIAVFAPGGIGVREGIMVGLLLEPLGASAALALAIGSRLVMTVAELAAALAGLPYQHKDQGEPTGD